MRISKEMRTGLLATVSLIILFGGYYFLKGADLFSSNRTYYCYYKSVDGLLTNANIAIRGFSVGHVSDFELEGTKGVKVTFLIQKSTPIPQGTKAMIIADGLLGNKMIRLEIGSSSEIIPPKSFIPGDEEPSLMDNMSDQISPLMKGLRKTVTALDTVIEGINLITNSENRGNISAALKSINATAENLSLLTGMLAAENEQIKGILQNANSFTGGLAKSNDTIKHILSNLNSITGQVANANIQKTFTDLQGSITQLHGILNKMNSNDGTLGLLINDKELYNNVNGSLKSLEKLMADLKEHPSRYVNISVFGKKKK